MWQRELKRHVEWEHGKGVGGKIGKIRYELSTHPGQLRTMVSVIKDKVLSQPNLLGVSELHFKICVYLYVCMIVCVCIYVCEPHAFLSPGRS